MGRETDFALSARWADDIHREMPKVQCRLYFDECNAGRDCTEQCLFAEFDVFEHFDFYRAEVCHHGGACWEDSCVELFVQPPSSPLYMNFECNSLGCCLAECGKDRWNRRRFTDAEYARLFVRAEILAREETTIRWKLQLGIPLDVLGISNSDKLKGNVYKCGSKAKIPHYMSLFPVNTATPDFHRPEFFGDLTPLISPRRNHEGR